MLTLSLFPGIGLLDHAFELEGFCVVRGPDVIWGGDIRTFHPPSGKFNGVIGGPPCQSFSSLAHLVRANGHEPKFGNLIPEFERCVTEAAPDWFLMENVPQAPEAVVAGYGIKSFLLDNSALAGEGGFGLEQRRARRFTFGLRGREAPNLLRWIDMAVFLLPDAEKPVTAMHDSIENLDAWSKARRQDIAAVGHGEPPGPRDKRRRQAVLSDPSAVPVKLGGSGKVKRTVHAVSSSARGKGKQRPNSGGNTKQGRYRLADALRLQGLPEDHLEHCPMTAEGKLKAVANGVPISMGRAIAKAIKCALEAP